VDLFAARARSPWCSRPAGARTPRSGTSSSRRYGPATASGRWSTTARGSVAAARAHRRTGIDDEAEALRRELDRHGVSAPVVLAAHSYGGFVATLWPRRTRGSPGSSSSTPTWPDRLDVVLEAVARLVAAVRGAEP
jgi:pimeloyl-ACP methyl ester carboxylesterase